LILTPFPSATLVQQRNALRTHRRRPTWQLYCRQRVSSPNSRRTIPLKASTTVIQLSSYHPNFYSICRNTGLQVLRNKGVIRGITNWGQFDLPRPITKHQTQHHLGHYFIMQFDSSVAVQTEIKRNLGLDPRMIRFSVVKLGNKLGTTQESMEHFDGKIQWKNQKTDDEYQERRSSGFGGLIK
jgi:small subunit ribosomal protein S6